MSNICFKESNTRTNTHTFNTVNTSLRKCNDLKIQISRTQEFSPLRIQPTYNESHLLAEKQVFWQGLAGDTGK